jgi:predicted RNA-binding Zn-ribbon protein involved in translation (DUF1610 family)
VSAIPNPTPESYADEHVCPACASRSLTTGRVSATERATVDVFACDDCGDFWFERDGSRLTPAAMRDLGLLA